jgi:hypothetical protein
LLVGKSELEALNVELYSVVESLRGSIMKIRSTRREHAQDRPFGLADIGTGATLAFRT